MGVPNSRGCQIPYDTALSAHAEPRSPKDIAGSDIMKLKVSWRDISAFGPKELINNEISQITVVQWHPILKFYIF